MNAYVENMQALHRQIAFMRGMIWALVLSNAITVFALIYKVLL